MEKVEDGLTGEIPDAMVEEQAQRFVENFKMQVQSQGIPFDQYMKMTNMDEAALLEQAKEPALRQVRVDLAVGAIVKAEGLEASDEEVEAEYAKLAEQYGMAVEDVKKYMNVEMVKEQVVRAKAIAVVVDSAVAVKPEAKAEEPGEEKPKAKKTAKKAKKAEESEGAEGAEAAPAGEAEE